MKKRTILVLGLFILLILITQKDFLTKKTVLITRGQQIAYLKEHEQEMTEGIKKNHPKIESIQWDWDSVEIKVIQPDAGGIPIGEKYYELRIEGEFNHIENSSFTSIAQLESKNSYPKINAFYLSQPLRVDGKLYE